MSQKLSGNTKGLAPSQIRNVERLYGRKLENNEVVSLDFARELFDLAKALRRKIGVLISREGRIEEVFLGSKDLLYMPELGRYRLGAGRLRRLRLIFSDLSSDPKKVHIPNDIYTDLEKLRFDLVAGVKFADNRSLMSYAYNLPYSKESKDNVATEEVSDLGRFSLDFTNFIEELESEHALHTPKRQSSEGELAMLVGVYDKRRKDYDSSIQELAELARTAGVNVVDTMIQLRKPDPKTLLGKGKLEEVLLQCLRVGAELVIFDTELKPSQWRIITNSTNLKVLDRSMLILDIFAQRAKSSDGRLQVELAQLKYNLPRLVEKDVGLSRLTGGIGGRGPGETKLEIGRRRMRDRIGQLEKRIDKLGDQRQLRRKRRKGQAIPLVAILGYTNVGKSTLFNALTQSREIAEDKLFATLDPSQRRFFLSVTAPSTSGNEILQSEMRMGQIIFSDTVGFIRDLPEELLSAFRTTLEEVGEAAMLLHVLDASDPDIGKRYNAVNKILEDMRITDIPLQVVLNKCDAIDQRQAELLCLEYEGLAVSAINREGLEELKQTIGMELLEPPITNF